jgi:hypothetical protein
MCHRKYFFPVISSFFPNQMFLCPSKQFLPLQSKLQNFVNSADKIFPIRKMLHTGWQTKWYYAESFSIRKKGLR